MVSPKVAVEPAIPASASRGRQLDLQLLDAVISHTEAVLDRAIACSYGPQTVQFQELLRRYDGDLVVRQTEQAIADAERQMTNLRARAAQEAHRLAFDDLVADHQLDPVEVRAFQLALAASLDSGIRKRIALYKDNILQSFVDVDLVLKLLYPSRSERLAARDIFAPTSRLVRGKLVELAMPKDALTTEYLLVYEVRVPSRVTSYALGAEALDDRVADCARISLPATALDQVVLPEDDRTSIVGLLKHYMEHRRDALDRRDAQRLAGPKALDAPPDAPATPAGLSLTGNALVVQITGAPGTGKTMLVAAVAKTLEARLLTVDCPKLASDPRLVTSRLERVFHEARTRQLVLALDNAESLLSAGNAMAAAVFRQLEEHVGLTIVITQQSQGLDLALERWVAFHLKLEIPTPTDRETLWRLHLPPDAPLADDVDLPTIAQQFEFTGGQVRNAVLLALNRALTKTDSPIIDQALLNQCAQSQIRADMEELSHKTELKLRMEHLVLPADELALVREVLNAAKVRSYVMSHWGFGKRLATGRGLVALFGGEPGTGKTLAAEIIASELAMPLFRVSIPRIMSKWVGETEKNIAKIFTKARASHSVLLFDEADSLFTSRVKVESSVDRFANMETNLLLQEIERFEGLCILTTNHEKNIDDAFQRRINFKIDFPFPDPDQREKIWRTLFPDECPIDDDIDYYLLAENFELSGGYIKNAIVRAAYRAAVAGSPISMSDIEKSAEQECRNAGKIFRSLDSGGFGTF